MRLKLHGAFHLPEELRSVRDCMQAGTTSDVISELTRLANTGSSDAAAALAYTILVGTPDVPPSAIDALAVLDRYFGDSSYKKWVRSWTLYESGQQDKALDVMRVAAIELFPPAVADFGRMLAIGVGVGSPQPQLAEPLYRSALGLGHGPALIWLGHLWGKGWLGIGKRLISPLLILAGLLWVSWAYIFRPYSATSLAHIVRRTRRLWIAR